MPGILFYIRVGNCSIPLFFVILWNNLQNMTTASIKKRENIAEYLLYMWQIEDLIRAYRLDIDSIQTGIIDRYTSLSDAERAEMRGWYESLIDMMRRENVTEAGHLQLNRNVLGELQELHGRLLKNPKFAPYAAEYYNTLPFIVEIRAKAGENRKNELESCFDALYGILMLRLQGKEISEETTLAAKQISRFLGMLAGYYKKDYNNELDLEEE